MSELDNIAREIDSVRSAMQKMISGDDRLDVEPKTRTAVVHVLDIMSRINEQLRRIDAKSISGGNYGPGPVPPGAADIDQRTIPRGNLDSGDTVILR